MEETCLEEVIGTPAPDRKWEAAIILQGPSHPVNTPIAIREFLERNNENTLIIVATYRDKGGNPNPSTVEGKGRLVYIYISPPSREKYPDFWRTNFWNQNLQRLSSFIGLRYAKTLGIEWSIKCRSDSFLGMRNVHLYLRDCVLSNPILPFELDVNKNRERIVVNDINTTTQSQISVKYHKLGVYHIADFWLFGLTNDLMEYFDIREGCLWDEGRGIRTDTRPETHLGELWIRGLLGGKADIEFTELLARYFIVEDSSRVEFVFLKTYNYKEYLQKGPRFLKQVRSGRFGFGVITNEMWKTYLQAARKR